MKISLPDRGKVPLKPAELSELAVKAQMARDAMQTVHDAYKAKANQLRAEIASRYAGEAFRAISPQERRRVAEQETASRVTKLRLDAVATMDAIAREQLGPLMEAMNNSKVFYRSAADTMLRMTLDRERRGRIASSLATAGPTELWHAAVAALQASDVELAAAIVQALRAVPLDQQPFSPLEFAGRFAFPPHEKAVQAINGIDRDSQAAILLWRVVQQGRENPIAKIQAVIRDPALQQADNNAAVLRGADQERI